MLFWGVTEKMNKNNFHPTTMARLVLLIGIGIALLVTCCKSGNNQKSAAAINTDSLQTQLTTLTDSLQTSWNTMMAADDQKIGYMGQMLASIKKSCPHNAALHTQTLAQQKSLIETRYKSPDALTSEQIDRYDLATESLLSSLDSLYNAVPTKSCCAACDSLRTAISDLHGNLPIDRARYDSHAREYNVLVMQQKETLARIKPEYGNLKPKQLFALMQ